MANGAYPYQMAPPLPSDLDLHYLQIPFDLGSAGKGLRPLISGRSGKSPCWPVSVHYTPLHSPFIREKATDTQCSR